MGWSPELDDPVVAPPFAGFRDIGLQQYPRLQHPPRRALSFPDQRFKLFAFLAAQPHNILLYRNLLRSHDCPLRQSWRRKQITKSLSNWLKRATSLRKTDEGPKRMQLAIFAAGDPLDVRTWSGTPYFMSKALQVEVS